MQKTSQRTKNESQAQKMQILQFSTKENHYNYYPKSLTVCKKKFLNVPILLYERFDKLIQFLTVWKSFGIQLKEDFIDPKQN